MFILKLFARGRLPEHLVITIENFHIIVVVRFETTARQETEKEANHKVGHDGGVSSGFLKRGQVVVLFRSGPQVK